MGSLHNRESNSSELFSAHETARGLAADRIVREVELLEKLIDAIPVMIVIWDPDVRVVRFNREFERVLGWTEADANRDGFMERLYPDEDYRNRVIAFMTALEPGWRDFEVTAKNGDRIVSSWANIRLSDNRRVGIGVDMRDRRQAEQALREQREELRQLTDAVPVLISRVDAQQRYQFVNAAYETWFGQARTSMIGRSIEEVVGPDAYETIRPHAEAALAGKTVRFETEIQLREIGSRYVQAQYEPHIDDASGDVLGFYTVVTDITERRRAQEERVAAYQALERQHELLTSVLELMPAGVFIANAEGDLIETNAAARQLWGGDAPRVNMEAFDEYKGWFAETGEQLKADDWGMSKALRGEEVLEGQEIEIKTFDGKRKTILNYALPIRIGDRFEGAVAVSVDVTRLRATEHALRELNATLERRVAERTADLEARNKELQQFAFIASHDLREPLRKIQAFGDLLKEDGDLSPDKAEFFIERIQSSAKRMDDLLDDLLTFSRVATRTRPFKHVRLIDVINDACSDLMLPIGNAKADIDVTADVAIEADEGQLRQLLQHVIGNAVKFRRDGQAPKIRVSAAVETLDGTDMCCIVVEDNGIGFDGKYAERIFEPFERLHERGAYEGTGIGLAICKRIVQLHRGTITAESTPGKGSRFIVVLPVRTADEPTKSA